ncbi:diguanylate cyclase domain-containing protein [Oceanirhabdus sp. W0125-5]|uniref:diguanylate cyclase domain-containing protein n=1 Tax=Oceanirhabdus sp. W0125-5 TaxID=2999116 RepID=UPI0022F338E4|nr:diguanylate cyclase [Oceanirhabdus sp. W0125-5]WBW95522.1 diguanylate cyclase [Oceanirhabdus sp. W0125-5]
MNNFEIIDRIQLAISFIEHNLKNHITIEDISSSAFMSKSSFYNLFSNITGVTLKEYVRKRRLNESAKILLKEDLTVLDIALLYQYNSYEAYSRAFKKLFGVSPISYRKNNISVNIYPRINFKNTKIQGEIKMISNFTSNDTVLETIKNSTNGYVLDIDIDSFLKINNTFGHKNGDIVLLEVHKRISEVLKVNNIDTEVYRIAGDEFGVVLKNIDENLVKKISSEIIDSMNTPINGEDAEIPCTLTIGISEFSINTDSSKVLDSAKKAMFTAKENGKNQYCFQ